MGRMRRSLSFLSEPVVKKAGCTITIRGINSSARARADKTWSPHRFSCLQPVDAASSTHPSIHPSIKFTGMRRPQSDFLGALQKFSNANLPAGLTYLNQQQTIIFSPTQTHTQLYVCVQHTASLPAAIDRCGWCLLLRSDWLPTVFTLLGMQLKLERDGDGIHVHSRLRLRPTFWLLVNMSVLVLFVAKTPVPSGKMNFCVDLFLCSSS